MKLANLRTNVINVSIKALDKARPKTPTVGQQLCELIDSADVPTAAKLAALDQIRATIKEMDNA